MTSPHQEHYAETTQEILDYVLDLTDLGPLKRDEIRRRHDEAKGWEEAELLNEINNPSFEEWIGEGRGYVPRFLDWLSQPLAGASFVLVLTHGPGIGLCGFVLAGLCLFVSWLVER